jgi:hypothetical protein
VASDSGPKRILDGLKPAALIVEVAAPQRIDVQSQGRMRQVRCRTCRVTVEIGILRRLHSGWQSPVAERIAVPRMSARSSVGPADGSRARRSLWLWLWLLRCHTDGDRK